MSTTPTPSITPAPIVDAGVFTPLLAPQVQQDLAARAPTPAQDQQQVAMLVAQIDLRDSNSIVFFGSKAQEQLTTISDQMLEGVRN
ncbi:MAG TPA: toxic anion resistance protein, partial [Candidatus Competibacteraceae bacterium]|nr:toxic anion resistance protein [Candidatus Competibacteraceae bacterium]